MAIGEISREAAVCFFIRFGGLFPTVHVQADIRRTRQPGVTHAPHEGGCMMVRSRDDIYLMSDLKGKKISTTWPSVHSRPHC
jgi:hypothetical protein